MYKYFELRRLKKQKKFEAEFDEAFKQFMKEEMHAKHIK